MYYRLDLVFSYWIFAWFLFYYFKIVSYNPKIAIILSLTYNIFTLFLMAYFRVPFINLAGFIFINFFIKVLPLWYVWNTKMKLDDFLFLLFLFLVYILWCTINKINIIQHKMNMFQSLISGKAETPFLHLLQQLATYFK